MTVPFTIAPIFAMYRSVTSSPSGLSWRMMVSTLSRLTNSEMNTYEKQDRRRHPAEHAARGPLQEAQQPLADVLRDGGHRTPKRVRGDL